MHVKDIWVDIEITSSQLKIFKGGKVAIRKWKPGEIQETGKVGINLKQAIDNVYYVDGMQRINSTIKELNLLPKRHKKVYKTEIMSRENSLTCLNSITGHSLFKAQEVGTYKFFDN